MSDRAQVLQQVAQVIERLPNKEAQQNVAASAFILAGLLLDKSIVQRLLRQDIMKESVTYQALMEEGRGQGKDQTQREVDRNAARGDGDRGDCSDYKALDQANPSNPIG